MTNIVFPRLTNLLIATLVLLGPVAAGAQDISGPTNPMGQLGGAEAYHAKLFPNQPYYAAREPSDRTVSGAQIFGAKIRGETTVVSSGQETANSQPGNK